MQDYAVQDMYGAILKSYINWLALAVKKGMVRAN
jgi:hypothetical protein